MKRVHWSRGRAPGDVFFVTLCGQMESEPAAFPEHVTCLKCKKLLRDLHPDTSAASYVQSVFEVRLTSEYEPMEFKPLPPLFDPMSDLPMVTQSTWSAIKDRTHWCMSCPTCLWFSELKADAEANPWRKHHGPGQVTFRWPSVTAALEWFVALRMDGFSMGAIGDALANLGKLGAVIRSGGSMQRAVEEADDALAIDSALSECYLERSRRGLSRAERLYCLFATIVGRPPMKPHEVAAELRRRNEALVVLSGPMVSAVASQGRSVVLEYLSERGMVPPR